MLTVLTPEEALQCVAEAFSPCLEAETVPLADACGRILLRDVTASEFVPGFDRSTVDGYAVYAADTFGCSDALPAILRRQGEVAMGEGAETALDRGCCMAIPTGGALPPGADAAAMLEYAEDYGDGTVGILKPVAPGENLIFRGDDVKPGQTVLPAGRRLTPQDIGALAALGAAAVELRRKPRVGILSTGDELVPVDSAPGPGQVRDVNSAMLRALLMNAGAEAKCFGILKDDDALLGRALDEALLSCDAVLISGGSSVGRKDATCRVIAARGELLFHGVAMKPGKPTILGRVGGKAVFGLPGHPAAACIAAQLFVLPLLDRLAGHAAARCAVPAVLTDPVSANHGRAQYMAVQLETHDGIVYARPVRGKSGLITALAGADGWFCIPRDREGAAAGEQIDVYLYD
jgi:molybdopterin molybdotransferase